MHTGNWRLTVTVLLNKNSRSKRQQLLKYWPSFSGIMIKHNSPQSVSFNAIQSYTYKEKIREFSIFICKESIKT